MDNLGLLYYAAKGMGMENEDFQTAYKTVKEYFTSIQDKTTDYKLGAASALLEILDSDLCKK